MNNIRRAAMDLDPHAVPESTPVVVGVGQVSERLGETDYEARSPADLGGDAARVALLDAGVSAGAIEVIAATRQFDNSNPMATSPLGRPDNYPRAVGTRIGADPARAIQEVAGGQSPQRLISEMAASIASGAHSVALVVGAEAISTAEHFRDADEAPDWGEVIGGQLEDRGYGIAGQLTRVQMSHGLATGPAMFALCENARRRTMGLSSSEHRRELGELFSRFSTVAAANPHSAAPAERSAEELITQTDRNRMISYPYTRYLVAREKVNQGAAALLMSVGKARELAVSPDRWVFLHGSANLVEPPLLQRPNFGAYPAGVAAVTQALDRAGLDLADIDAFDLYSCFPIAVLALCDGLGLSPDDPRGLTLAGGLPFFGGPGNNYSLHAIAEAVSFARTRPTSKVLVAANGGVMAKCSVGVYSSEPAPWREDRSADIQARLDAVDLQEEVRHPDGPALIESFTVEYSRDGANGIVVGRLESDGRRFIASSSGTDDEMLEHLTSDDVFDSTIYVQSFGWGNRVATTPERMTDLYPASPSGFRDSYDDIRIDREGHLLTVTIDRPEARNALTPDSMAELEHVFDAFFEDDDLWVAILTGSGDRAFCSGYDLRYGASGKPGWAPKSGFGGLTSRRWMPKPVIAAVNGNALGGGFEIALACHLVVADEAAKFGLTEVSVGLIAGAGGLIRLPRSVPRQVANELILTGRRVGAAELHQHGVVTRLAAEGETLVVARALAEEILAVSPTSVRLSLKAMHEGDRFTDAVDAIYAGDDAIDELNVTADMREGMLAFAEKRAPRWQNR